METIYRPMTKPVLLYPGAAAKLHACVLNGPCGAGGVLADFMPHGLSSFDG